MSKVIKLRKGLDINLVGSAERVVATAPASQLYALTPEDYVGVTPKLLVSVDQRVKAGEPIFFDKENPEVLFTSPVSGTLKQVVRGEKRKILSIEIESDGKLESVLFEAAKTAEQAKQLLLSSGMWPMLKRRPFGTIAKVDELPRAIFVSGFDTAPLAGDIDFMVGDKIKDIEAGVALLKLLTGKEVFLTLSSSSSVLSKIKGVNLNYVEGRHPAGNVGVQISAIAPIAKGEVVWTVDIQHLAMIGSLALTGKVDFSKTVAVVGSGFKKPSYCKVICGAPIVSVIAGNFVGGNYRLINGNPLCGNTTSMEGYVGFYNNQLTAIPQGDEYELLGWAMPRFNKFSFSKGYFSWLMPGKKYNLDTNLNGGQRAFVMNGLYEKVMPMDIYPVYLLKAIMAGDIDKMENLGIYEVVEEDLALCEFICPSKIEWQKTLRQGINLMIKEL